MLAKYWKPSEMAKIAYSGPFYPIWGPIKPQLTHTTPNQYQNQIFVSFLHPKND